MTKELNPVAVDPHEIQSLLENAQWLSALGSGEPAEGAIPLTSLGQWNMLCTQRAEEEFGLQTPPAEVSIPAFEWLSDDYGFREPGAARPEVMALYRIALKGLTGVGRNSWVQVGATDFQESIKLMVRHAIRMALSPRAKPEPRFWLGVLQHYAKGRWPAGITDDGRIVLI